MPLSRDDFELALRQFKPKKYSNTVKGYQNKDVVEEPRDKTSRSRKKSSRDTKPPKESKKLKALKRAKERKERRETAPPGAVVVPDTSTSNTTEPNHVWIPWHYWIVLGVWGTLVLYYLSKK